MTTHTIICANCWRPVEAAGRATKYCPECAKIMREQQRRIQAKKRQSQYKKPSASGRKKPQKSIAQINAEARTMGLTYGQYVARLQER